MLTHYNELLKDVAGTKIVRAQYLVHMSKLCELTVISTKLEFEESRFITVQCASDGESLRLDKDVFETADLGDAGRLEIIDAYDGVPKALSLSCPGHTIFFQM